MGDSVASAEPHTSERSGFHLALLSVDLPGKDYVLEELRRRFSQARQPVEIVSWTQCASAANELVIADTERYPYNDLHKLSAMVTAYRRLPDSTRSGSFRHQVARPSLRSDRRSDAPTVTFGTDGLFEASLKMAAYTLIYNEVIPQLRSRGAIVIERLIGFEDVARDCVAYRTSEGRASNEEDVDAMLSHASALFGRDYAPDMGVFLPVDRQRLRQSGVSDRKRETLERSSDLAPESMLAMQIECNTVFARFASTHRWYVPDLTGPYSHGQARNVAKSIFRQVADGGKLRVPD